MTSILSRILPGPKTKTTARLDAARTDLERRKGEREKAEKAKADALGAEQKKLEAARAQFEESGNSDDASKLVTAEQTFSTLTDWHARALARISESIAAHESAVTKLALDCEAEALVAAFGARHAAHVALPELIEKFLASVSLPPELPEASPEVRTLALGKLDALPPGAKRAAEITGFGGLGALELAPRRVELRALGEKVSRFGQRLVAVALASTDLETLRSQIDAPHPQRIIPAAE